MYNSNPAFGQQPGQVPGYGYPQQQPGYPPQQPGYPPQQPGGYPPQQAGYPPQQAGYHPGQGGYPSQQGVYPPQPGAYPPPGGYAPSGPIGTTTPPATGGGYSTDPVSLFAEKAIRQAFVSKVFSILSIQLMFTSVMIGIFVLNEDSKRYFASTGQPWLFLGIGIFLITFLILACVESARRAAPCNLILLTALTFGYGLMASIASCQYDTKIVLLAFLATALSCFIIVLFAKNTSYDITGCGTGLCLLSLAHFVIGILMVAILVPLGFASAVNLGISISGAFIASLYLVYDVQLIMGGKKCEISPEEYIMASVMLYIDIMQIFIYLLRIFGQLSKDN